MWINIRVVGNVKYMKRIQLSKVAGRIIWKSCGNLESVGINMRVVGKFMCKSSCIVKIYEQWDEHQGGGEVQIFERKMTKDICKSRLTLNSGH